MVPIFLQSLINQPLHNAQRQFEMRFEIPFMKSKAGSW